MDTILFVDDHKSIRQYCKQELEAEGYHVILAQDGEEAICLLAERVPDIVVLDVHMPRYNGYQTLRRIKADRPELPVIFYTIAADDCATEVDTRPLAACVQKSEDLSDLVLAIRQALESSKHAATQ